MSGGSEGGIMPWGKTVRSLADVLVDKVTMTCAEPSSPVTGTTECIPRADCCEICGTTKTCGNSGRSRCCDRHTGRV